MNIIMDFLAGQQADRIIAISDHAEEQLIKRYGFDKTKVRMIPHGVNTEKFTPCSQSHPAVNSDRITLLYVGRIGPRKGIDLVLEALNKANNDNIEFLIAGTGRHEQNLKEKSKSLNVESQTEFLGYIPEDELPELYSSADMFILPSLYEGFGLVLLEAMACGTPVIGTDVGGIPTAIDDKETGIVVDRNVSAITTAIDKIASNKKYRENLSQSAEKNSKNMTWDSVVDKVEQLYENIERSSV
jgi:glycosyltransferase involved in cell wall biosynthesis